MASEDTDNARLAAPPRDPWPTDRITRAELTRVADEVAAATWRLGLRRWFWGEGVCLLGLVQVAQATGRPIPTEVIEWLDGHLAPGAPDPSLTLDHVNEVAPGTAALVVAGDPSTGRSGYLPAVERLARWSESDAVTRDPGGAIEHWPGGVWADTMYMCGVFLARLGAATDDRRRLVEGLRQIHAHLQVLQFDNGLVVHGSHRGEAVPCFWGRANAWAALAQVEAIETIASLPADRLDDQVRALDADIRAALHRQVTALTRHQPEHGVWDVLVDGQVECRGILETSAAAGLAAALLRAGDLLDDPALTEAGWRALRGVLPYVQDGVLTRVSAGTVLQLVPFGYSVIRDDRAQPWGQGLLLTALAAGIERTGREPTS